MEILLFIYSSLFRNIYLFNGTGEILGDGEGDSVESQSRSVFSGVILSVALV